MALPLIPEQVGGFVLCLWTKQCATWALSRTILRSTPAGRLRGSVCFFIKAGGLKAAGDFEHKKRWDQGYLLSLDSGGIIGGLGVLLVGAGHLGDGRHHNLRTLDLALQLDMMGLDLICRFSDYYEHLPGRTSL